MAGPSIFYPQTSPVVRPIPLRQHYQIMRLCTLLLCATMLLIGCPSASPPAQTDPYDSGGPLLPEQAAYDVTFYDLAVRVEPAERTIAGTLTATARIVSPTAHFVLDLDPLLDVEAVTEVGEEGTRTALAFERRGGRIWAAFPYMKQPGDAVTVEVVYGGQPREAPKHGGTDDFLLGLPMSLRRSTGTSSPA